LNAEAGRDRVLSAAELKTIWNALPLGSDYRDILRLLILTGSRRAEIGNLAWSEISPEGVITVPAVRSKNGQEHRIPLSAPALAILEARQRVDGRDLIFGRGEGGFNGWSACKTRLDAALGTGMALWTVHDVRRTVSTQMHELGVEPHIVEAVLNHVSGHRRGVAGRYNHAIYAAPKRAALDLWATRVMTIIGDNVVPMRRPRLA
jgi:integrase